MTGAELRDWRMRHNMTQEELGERLGVNQVDISEWERDRKPLPTDLRSSLDAMVSDEWQQSAVSRVEAFVREAG